MEDFLLHRCVTSDVSKATNIKSHATSSLWQTKGRAEYTVVQENRQAHGASRIILEAMLKLVLRSPKTTSVLLLTLDSAEIAQSVDASPKLTHVDYSADFANFQMSNSHLLPRIVQDIEKVEATILLTDAISSRPLVVVLDSLNALVQQTSLQQVLLFLRQLRGHAVIGSIIARFNAGAESSGAAQALAAQATAVVLVETRSSLRSYPLLSQERKREIPKNMHGLVLLVRQKKNGRSSESIEYFQVSFNKVQFLTITDEKRPSVSTGAAKRVEPAGVKELSLYRISEVRLTPFVDQFKQTQLPVRQDEVSFNLSISAEEQRAKSQVQLPYKHQDSKSNPNSVGSKREKSTATSNPLFFIDDDDPDWDDDDLDDDLDF
ncbi:hypothetical protein CCR75_000385 [Bremia lactucae]|uniref:Elongator complex protein 5 n=1 Tax=Bremia lactucae TaxID=4779 RepID=A0A976FPM4_BRELC|nr:hypothetical protein CCR75_000385 [Bremia lactucae]